MALSQVSGNSETEMYEEEASRHSGGTPSCSYPLVPPPSPLVEPNQHPSDLEQDEEESDIPCLCGCTRTCADPLPREPRPVQGFSAFSALHAAVVSSMYTSDSSSETADDSDDEDSDLRRARIDMDSEFSGSEIESDDDTLVDYSDTETLVSEDLDFEDHTEDVLGIWA